MSALDAWEFDAAPQSESAAREADAPVYPARAGDRGDVDLQCGYCGMVVLAGWNLTALANVEQRICSGCGARSVEPRVFALVVAIERRRSDN